VKKEIKRRTRFNKKQKQTSFYLDVENFTFLSIVLAYVLFGPYYFSILSFDPKLYFFFMMWPLDEERGHIKLPKMIKEIESVRQAIF